MDDFTLARHLVPEDVESGLTVIRRMTPEKRAAYERLIWVGEELSAGRVPPSVIVDPPRRKRPPSPPQPPSSGAHK